MTLWCANLLHSLSLSLRFVHEVLHPYRKAEQRRKIPKARTSFELSRGVLDTEEAAMASPSTPGEILISSIRYLIVSRSVVRIVRSRWIRC